MTINVASHLANLAVRDPDRIAVRLPHGRGRQTLTFRQLFEESDALAQGLNDLGIQRGTRTVVMVPPSLEFFVLTFALLKAGIVPVLIDPGMGIKNLGRCLAEAEPTAFIGIAKAHLARRILGWGRATIRDTVNVGSNRFFCSRSYGELVESGKKRPFTAPNVTINELAAVLFTSGSTGIAKGAEYTHGMFSSQVELLKATYGIEPGEIDLCTFPLFALFGPALGMTCIIPDMDATRPASIDPKKTLATVRQFGVTNLFGSPAVIRRLSEYGEPLPTLRRAISAGAPASAPVVERFAKLLTPPAQLYTPYGATESLPVANIGSREILDETRALTEAGKGVCVGRPVPGIQVRIIQINDEPITEWDDRLLTKPGEIGEIVVEGPVVSPRYFHREEATRLAKIRRGETILHRMGDVGYFDDRGRLWFCGRKSHRVVTPTGTLFTDQVEPVLNTVPGIVRTALLGVRIGGVMTPVVAYESEKGGDNRTLEQSLAKKAGQFEVTKPVTIFLPYPGAFPVDIRHNSKIFREKMVPWAESHRTIQALARARNEQS